MTWTLRDRAEGTETSTRASATGNEAPTRASASGKGTEKRFDPAKHVAIRLKKEVLAKILSSEIAMLEPFFLECKKDGIGPGDWPQISGRLVDPPSK